MLTPPDGLSEESLVSALARHWRLNAASLAYRPVGFGSHHWEGADLAGARRFVTADDLYKKRMCLGESLNIAFERPRPGLTAAIDRRNQGAACLIAPVPAAHGQVRERGPFTRPLARLIGANDGAIESLLARYDELSRQARSRPSRMVPTHGEPHPGNTMLTPDGWRLIDWDTVLFAAPERDLWDIDPGDGSVHRAYAAATGVRPLPHLLELFRIRWDLADRAHRRLRLS